MHVEDNEEWSTEWKKKFQWSYCQHLHEIWINNMKIIERISVLFI